MWNYFVCKVIWKLYNCLEIIFKIKSYHEWVILPLHLKYIVGYCVFSRSFSLHEHNNRRDSKCCTEKDKNNSDWHPHIWNTNSTSFTLLARFDISTLIAACSVHFLRISNIDGNSGCLMWRIWSGQIDNDARVVTGILMFKICEH